ncbi:MAG: hypothetical protein FD171_1474 [Actinobacteria bacterium]|nr:MAG: hypothetical protein FD171_1474 [Actinomycetota bacterium]
MWHGKEQVRYRKLGNTDSTVSDGAIGCFGYWGDGKYPIRHAAAIMNEAFDLVLASWRAPFLLKGTW